MHGPEKRLPPDTHGRDDAEPGDGARLHRRGRARRGAADSAGGEHAGAREAGDRVVAAERERVVEDDVGFAVTRDVGDDVDVALGIGGLVADGRRVDARLDRHDAGDRLERARGPHAVAERALDARDGDAPVAEHLAHDLRLGEVVRARAGAVGVHEVDVGGRDPAVGDRAAHRLDAAERVGVRARDVVGVARQAVAADFRLGDGAAPDGVLLRLENDQPRPLAEDEPLAVQVERLAAIRRHGGEPHEAGELELLNEFGGAGDDHVGAPCADQVGAEADRVVARRARRGEREHHALGADGAGDVDRQERRAVLRQERALHAARAAGDPRVVEILEELGFAHRRAEDDRRAPAAQRFGRDARVLDRHARGREDHRGAAPGAPRLRGREVIARAEVLHLTGEVAAERGGIERLDRRDAALPFGEGTKELFATEADGADDAHARDEDAAARRRRRRRFRSRVHAVAYSAVPMGAATSRPDKNGAKTASRAANEVRSGAAPPRNGVRSRAVP